MRIICLSAESADICARLSAWDEVVAVTAFASQHGLDPRPVIGGFSKTDVGRIARLAPDLVITFSDVQADITAQLVRSGCSVLATNQRTLAEIGKTIRMIGGIIGRPTEADRLAEHFAMEIETLRSPAEQKPRVYFEEWPDPMISGIAWVGELVDVAGGIDVFENRRATAARDRRVTPEEVIAANPDVILASWCGRKVDPESIRQRPGFDQIAAVRQGALHALESDILLQPGPRLIEGASELLRVFDEWRSSQSLSDCTPVDFPIL